MRLIQSLTFLLWISSVSARVGIRDDQDTEDEDFESRNLRFVQDQGGISEGSNAGGNAGDNPGNGRDNPGNGGDNPGNGVGGNPDDGSNPGDDNRFIPNQFIIEISKEGDRAKGLLYALLMSNPDAEVIYSYATVFTGYAIRGIPEAALLNLARLNPDVILSIEQDQVVQTSQALPWGLDRVDQIGRTLDGVYSPPAGLDGQGVDIYIIDTGVFGGHDEFKNRMKPGFSAFGGSTNDLFGHGTHVASAYEYPIYV